MNRYKFNYQVYEHYVEVQYGDQYVFYTDRTNTVDAKNVAEAVMMLYDDFLVQNNRYLHVLANVNLLKTRRC